MGVIYEPKGPAREYAELACNLFPVLAHMTPGGQAGRPTLKGEGPAQDVARRVAAYRKAHPGAKWPELFERVSNHYASVKSMRWSLVKRGLADG